MAPESRPLTAREDTGKQQLVNCLATGLLAGAEKEMSEQVNNELNPQMAVDTLSQDVKILAVQDPEQQAGGKRSIPRFFEHETRYLIFSMYYLPLLKRRFYFLQNLLLTF